MAQPTQIRKPDLGAEGFNPASTVTDPGHLQAHERDHNHDHDDHDYAQGGITITRAAGPHTSAWG